MSSAEDIGNRNDESYAAPGAARAVPGGRVRKSPDTVASTTGKPSARRDHAGEPPRALPKSGVEPELRPYPISVPSAARDLLTLSRPSGITPFPPIRLSLRGPRSRSGRGPRQFPEDGLGVGGRPGHFLPSQWQDGGRRLRCVVQRSPRASTPLPASAREVRVRLQCLVGSGLHQGGSRLGNLHPDSVDRQRSGEANRRPPGQPPVDHEGGEV